MDILVPTNINDITLEQYQRFALINTEDQDQEFFIHKTIEIFCNVDLKTINKFPIKDAREISEDILAVLNQNVPFTDRFELDGVKYGFIPDLQQMSLGEFIDLEDSLKSAKDFHKATSVMFRPIKKEFKNLYSIEPYEASRDMQELMKKAPIGIISASIVFFYTIVNELLMVSKVFSETELREAMTIVEKVNSQRNTVGLTQYTHYVEVLRQNMEKLHE
jgi:spore coat polysaccharide biosynthesis predicted glycosyltransferase SpsG